MITIIDNERDIVYNKDIENKEPENTKNKL